MDGRRESAGPTSREESFAPAIIATLTLTAPAGQQAQVLGALRAFLGRTRVETGCAACALYEDAEDPAILHYVEEWRTEWHLERHLRSSRYQRLLRIMEASAKPPALRFTWISDQRGLEYVTAVLGVCGDVGC